MTVDQIIALTGQVAWPFAAIIGLLLLPLYMPYVTKLTMLTTQAKDLISSTEKMAELITKFEQLKGTLAPLQLQISELKAQLQLPSLEAVVADSASLAPPKQDVEAWTATVRTEWDRAKNAIKGIASRFDIADVDLSAIGASTSAVQAVADSLVERQVIDAGTANLMTDLSTQFQLWTRSRNRSAYLNADVVSEFSWKVASLVKTLGRARRS